jgi:hypothetical protein
VEQAAVDALMQTAGPIRSEQTDVAGGFGCHIFGAGHPGLKLLSFTRPDASPDMSILRNPGSRFSFV